jgi:hypothetical protein
MIEARGLVKRYGSTRAVNDLSFSIRPGLRHPAAAIACMTAVLFVLPTIAQALPDSWRNPVTEFCSSPSCTPSPGRCLTAGTPEGGQVAMARVSR